MAGPKITRLGDPANPYSGKRTPTAAPTPAQQAINRANSQKVAPVVRTPAPKTPAKRVPIMQQLNDQYGGGARKRAIDAAVDAAVTGKPPRKGR